MYYSFAPLEGITDSVYRRAHARFYPGLARYYTPFISTNQNHVFTPRDLRELAPENNPGLTLVPQLLGKNADDFLWAAGALRDMGYSEVNLNLGCPSGTVTAKGKGSGFLQYPQQLDAFLEAIFSACPIKISVKTRIGYASADEFAALCEIYGRYPLSELIIHPRTAKEQYSGSIHHASFETAAALCKNIPLVYNGDIMSINDCSHLQQLHPQAAGLMLGRGLIARPWLLNGNCDINTLRSFHRTLCEEYPVVFGSENSALHRMKAIWFYMLPVFRGGERYAKALKKARRWQDFISTADDILSRCDITEEQEST